MSMELTLKKKHRAFAGEVRFYSHQSALTRTPMNFSVFVPDQASRSGLIWLSGLTCSEENFTTKSGYLKCASELGLTVFAPDTSPRGLDLPRIRDKYDFGEGASFYIDATTPGYCDHFKMESYIAQEFWQIVTDHFCDSDKIGISGHSMGGHGALTLALKYPEKMKSVSAFSPICNPSVVPWGKNAFEGYLGSESGDSWKKHDAVELLRAGKRFNGAVLVDQGGSDDFLAEQLKPENLESVCKAVGQPLNLRIQTGYDHSYYFISSFIEDHLRFHAESLFRSSHSK